MELFRRKKKLQEAPAEVRSNASGIPSNREMLENAGITFDFFVDSAEGPAFYLDPVEVEKLARSAEVRLLGKKAIEG